jgi:hypothetical protein
MSEKSFIFAEIFYSWKIKVQKFFQGGGKT